MMHYHVCIFKDKESSEMRVAPQKFPAALRGHLKGHKNTHDYQIDINKVEHLEFGQSLKYFVSRLGQTLIYL